MFLNNVRDFDTQTPVQPVGAIGLLPGTRVETARGWQDIAALKAGDLVHSYDGGLRVLHELRRRPGHVDAIRVPATVLGNDAELFLAPDQPVLIDTGRAYDWIGAPVALARAADLVGHRGIRRRAAPARHLLTPVFDEEEILFAATGLRVLAPSAGGDTHYLRLAREEVAEILRPQG